MALISVDTLYTTYDTYTSADALDYAQSPAGDDSGAYSTKVKVIESSGYYGFHINTYVTAILSGTCSAAATTASITTTTGLTWPEQANPSLPTLYAMIGAEIVTYSSYTIVGASVTVLNGLVRGLGGTDDTTHTYSALTDINVWPLTQGSVVSIEHDRDLEVFNINTTATISDPNRQYPDLTEVGMYTIPESLVAMVKYAA